MLQRHPLDSDIRSRVAPEVDLGEKPDTAQAHGPGRGASLRNVQQRALGPLPAASADVASAGARGASPSEMALGPVQRRGSGAQEDPQQVQDIAARGVEGAGSSMPHLDRIQESFGHHHVGDISAHVGGAAAQASQAIGASAYATDGKVAFASQPDLHTAAHEAAHVVQQRAGVQLYGGVGQAGDAYEQHADAVADAVVRGQSAQGLLDGHAGSGAGQAGVQRDTDGQAGHGAQPSADAKPEDPILHLGSFGADVRRLQKSLNDHGTVPRLSVDGVFGMRTRAALMAFQKKSGLAPSGSTDKETWDALKGTPKPQQPPPGEGAPEIDATTEALGKNMTTRMDQANGAAPYGLHEGIHYSYNYEYETKQGGHPELWKEDMRTGYADPEFFQKQGFMSWVLKPGKSASKAVKSWLKGLTVAECNSSVVVMEIDTLRAAVGDEKFDKFFGNEHGAINEQFRLKIHPGTQGTPVEWFMKSPDLTNLAADKEKKGEKLTDEDMDKNLHPGEWYYFYNHPKYLLKHPGGAWQGENSLYMGKKGGQRLWSGLGASNVSEDGMYDEMVSAYNAPRDRLDVMAMKQQGVMREDGTYVDPMYDPKNAQYPEHVSKATILNDPPFTLGGTTRKGGFMPNAGTTLDVEKVKQFRDFKG